MASVRLSTIINCDAASAWDALRDFGALHTRLAPGFVTDCQLADGARIVTFHNGMSVRERFVSSDDARRRLVWAVVGAPFEHHNGAATVAPDGAGRCRFEWQADMLPDMLAGEIEPMMREGLAAIKHHLEAGAAARTSMRHDT
jgi:hypothetical protein